MYDIRLDTELHVSWTCLSDTLKGPVELLWFNTRHEWLKMLALVLKGFCSVSRDNYNEGRVCVWRIVEGGTKESPTKPAFPPDTREVQVFLFVSFRRS